LILKNADKNLASIDTVLAATKPPAVIFIHSHPILLLFIEYYRFEGKKLKFVSCR
jgi:hypothetical protein